MRGAGLVAGPDHAGDGLRTRPPVRAVAATGRPQDQLTLIAVTGTNGKTTITFLVEALLRAAGHVPGVIGTVNYRYGDRVVPAPYTTPTPLELHPVLADMAAAYNDDRFALFPANTWNLAAPEVKIRKVLQSFLLGETDIDETLNALQDAANPA